MSGLSMDIEKKLEGRGIDPEKLEEAISPGIHQKMAAAVKGNNMAKKHHKYTHSTVEHHDDGSHTVTHHHEDGKSHKKYAAADHDSMMDGMMDHTSAPNPGEAEAEAGMPAGGAPEAGAGAPAGGAPAAGV